MTNLSFLPKLNLLIDKREIHNIGTCYRHDDQIIKELDKVEKQMLICLEEQNTKRNQKKKFHTDLQELLKLDEFISNLEEQKQKLLNEYIDPDKINHYISQIYSTYGEFYHIEKISLEGDLQVDYILTDDQNLTLFALETKNSYYSIRDCLSNPYIIKKWITTYNHYQNMGIPYSVLIFLPLDEERDEFIKKFPEAEDHFTSVIKIKNKLNKSFFDKKPIIKIKKIKHYGSNPNDHELYTKRLQNQMKQIIRVLDTIYYK